MTEIDTSRVEQACALLLEDADAQNTQPCEMTGLLPDDEREIAALIRALLASAEKAEAERDAAWNAAIDAAVRALDQRLRREQPGMTRLAQSLSAKKQPSLKYAVKRAGLDARMSSRDMVRTLRKGEPT